MTTCVHIDNQAGPRHAALASRMRPTAENCAPDMAEAVGLSGPEEPTIRLLTPPVRRKRVQDSSCGRVAAEIRGPALDPRAGRTLHVPGLSLGLTWMTATVEEMGHAPRWVQRVRPLPAETGSAPRIGSDT